MYSFIWSCIFQPIIYYIATREKVSENMKKLIPLLELPYFQQTIFMNSNDSIGFVRNGQTTIVRLVLHLIILMTFGLTYPILALLLTLTIIVEVFSRRLEIGIALESAIIVQDRSSIQISHIYNPNHLKQLELQLTDSWKVVDSCFWLLQLTVTSFWSLLFIDMIDNQYGVKAGLITAVCYFIGSNIFIQVFKYIIIKKWVLYLHYFDNYLSICHKKRETKVSPIIEMNEMFNDVKNPIDYT